VKKRYLLIGVLSVVLLASLFVTGDKEEVPFEKLLSLHKVKAPPGPYDWLAQHFEAGQTFEQYLLSNPTVPDEKKRSIYIVLLGDFDKTRNEIIQKTAKYIKAFYGMPVKFKKPIPLSSLPPTARRIHPQTKDKQILTSYIIEKVLKNDLPADAFCLIAFTSSDLWPGEGWNFVFGQASLEDRVGVWSIYRNGDPNIDEKSYQLCLKRTIKTGVHEIGHMFSLHHCIYYECLMNGSNHRKESDTRPLWLCPVCLKKLMWALKANPVKRYQNLIKVCRQFGFSEEEMFFKKSLQALRE